MLMKRGCSKVMFLMLIVVVIFMYEIYKNSQTKEVSQVKSEGGCSSNGCSLGGPRISTLKQEARAVEQEVERVVENVEHEVEGFVHSSFGSPF